MITVTAPKLNKTNSYIINEYFVDVTKLGRYSPSGRCLGYEYFLSITDGTKIIIHNRPYKKISEVKLAIKNLTAGG